MVLDIDIKISPNKIEDLSYQESLVLNKVKCDHKRIKSIRLDRKSIDARGKKPLFFLRFKVFVDEVEEPVSNILPLPIVQSEAKTCIVIGAGPAGYFAALELIQQGIKPIVLDRGKDVRSRRRDLKAIQQDGVVNPHSNYCFGEGGAGTYSDGKLYTRSHKRGSIKSILQILVEHGASSEILVDTHPHIGSNKLPGIVSAIKDTIIKSGGEVHFDSFVTDFKIESGSINGVLLASGKEIISDATILATGHSARDIYQLLYDKGINIEAKSFALGLRIEHRQSFIDGVQYNQPSRENELPASSYSLACQVGEKGVFSFCMCPGGLVVPAATAPGEIVVNGMSLSRRDSPYANSGFVTAIDLDELEKYGFTGVFGALNFQKEIEKAMFDAGDGSQKAPAQRVEDFVNGRISPTLNSTSYIPGLFSAPLHDILPAFISKRLRNGIRMIDQRMKGFMTNEANIIGVESRTSSPIRVPRDKETYMHEDVLGFFPCGEGAGYAGGILSAAMDGQNVAKGVKLFLNQ